MVAADQGHADTVKLLLQHGTSPDLQNRLGATALMMAVAIPLAPPPPPPSFEKTEELEGWNERWQRKMEIQLMIVKTLGMRGADLDLKNQRGWTALGMAQRSGKTQIAEFLRSMWRTPLPT